MRLINYKFGTLQADLIMIENNDIRWKQRFSNYCKALNQLQKFINICCKYLENILQRIRSN